MSNELTPFARACKTAYLTWDSKLRATSIIGDHTLYYADSDGYPMCHICAQEALAFTRAHEESPPWSPVAFGVNYDNPALRCEDCRDYIDMIDQPAYDAWVDEQAKDMVARGDFGA